MEIDELITINEKFLVLLDSRNATTFLNGSMNSNVVFDFEYDVNFYNTNNIATYCSVLNFSCPNSIYNINEYNNLLAITTSGLLNNYYVPYGSYNIKTLFIICLTNWF